jgi:hypothetical protein
MSGGSALRPQRWAQSLDVENAERQGFTVDTTVLDRLSRVRVRKKVDLDRLLATDDTLTDEILLQFARFRGEGLSDAANAVVRQGAPAG